MSMHAVVPVATLERVPIQRTGEVDIGYDAAVASRSPTIPAVEKTGGGRQRIVVSKSKEFACSFYAQCDTHGSDGKIVPANQK